MEEGTSLLTKIDGVKTTRTTIAPDHRTVGIASIGAIPSLQGVFAYVRKLPALCSSSDLADSPRAAIDNAYGIGYNLCDGLLQHGIIGRLVLHGFRGYDGSHDGVLLRLGRVWTCAVDGAVLGIAG